MRKIIQNIAIATIISTSITVIERPVIAQPILAQPYQPIVALDLPGIGDITSIIGDIFSGNFNFTDILGNLGEMAGLDPTLIAGLTTALGSFTGGGTDLGGALGSLGSLAGLNPDQIAMAEQIAGILPNIITAVNSGSISGVLDGLGAVLGILDPQKIASTVAAPDGSNSPGVIIGDGFDPVKPMQQASTPIEVRSATKMANAFARDQTYLNSQMVLGDDGQKRIEGNLETGASALQQSGKISQDMLASDANQVEMNQRSIKGAESSAELVEAATKAKASQDVLKVIAGLFGVNNVQNSLNTGQSLYVARNLAGVSNQLVGLQSENRIQSESLGMLEILNANSLQQQNDIANILELASEKEENKDLAISNAARDSIASYWIPGYAPSADAAAGGGI